jgi:phosphatidate cytidylyltransferase
MIYKANPLLWPPVWQMGGIILLLLLLATAAVWGLARIRPQGDWNELRSRVKSWWVMVAVFLGALAVHPAVSLAFFGLLSFWALKEYVTLLKTRPADHKALFLCFLAIPGQYYLVYIQWYGMFIIFIPVYFFLFLPVLLVLARDPKGFVSSVSQLQWGLMAFVFGLSHLGYLLTFRRAAEVGDGRSLLLFLVFITEISDVLQYVWGKLLGGKHILPTISPNKTWAGFLGGIMTMALLALPLRFLTPFGVGETLLVALLVGLAGFCGGAVMSAVKRDFGVKDFGSLIPGHGGMLDRVDSLCYAAPIFFHYVRYFYP